MRQFKNNQSDEYKQVREAIKHLAETEDADTALAAVSEAIYKIEEDMFRLREGVELRGDFHVCIERLKGASKCPDRPTKPCDSPQFLPGADHLSEWNKDGKTHLIVSQPYGLSFDDLVSIVDYCRKHGLEASIDAASWWYPGRTIVLIYRRA